MGDSGAAEQVLNDILAAIGIADSMIGILVFIAIVFVLKGVLKFARVSYVGNLEARLLKKLKMELFDAYSRMTYRYYIEENTGHFVNVINQQVTRFFKSLRYFGVFVAKSVTALSFLAFAVVIAWKFAIMVLVVGLGVLFLFKYLNTYVRDVSRLMSEEMSQLNKLLVQSLQSFKYILSTGQTENIRTGVAESVERLANHVFHQRMAQALTKSVRMPLSVVVITALLSIQVLVFQAPVTPIFVALLLFHKGLGAVMSMQSSWQQIMNRTGAIEMVNRELKEVRGHRENDGDRQINRLQNNIKFRDVCFAYNKEDGDVLHDINIIIPSNNTVAFVGESGAGKSTLIDMLTLLLRPRKGEILIDDVPSQEIDLESWRSQIGYVSQETAIFDDTVANNITLWKGRYEEEQGLREEVHEAARQAHADSFIRDLPHGYQTVVGERGVRLSGGQRQRLFIARELFKDPNLLILDEATSDLDSASEQHIQESFDSLQGSVTIVMIAHRLSTVKNADRVYVLDNGRVVEEGSYNELRTRENGEFREMVEMQSL